MITRLAFILMISSLMACNQAQSDNNATSAKKTDQSQQVGSEPGVDEELITTVEFKIKGTKEDMDTFGDGIVPWISLEKTDKEINRLIDPDEIVFPYTEVTLIIDYPLTTPITFKLTSGKDGFTRKELIKEISQRYHSIYEEEEQTATKKTIPVSERGTFINRNQTNGKYGIWGHNLSDLVLSSVDVYMNQEKKIYLRLGIES